MKEPSWMAGPDDLDIDPSPTREELWRLLEHSETPMYLIELVDKVVEDLEHQIPWECPVCMQRQLEADRAEAGG
jgi:hypothetical protein